MSHASLKTAAEDQSDSTVKKSIPTFNVAPTAIVVVPGFNGRPILPEHVETLKQAWRAGKKAGYNPLPELTLRMVNGKPHLIDGEHRLTCYLELIAEGEPIERVPCKEFKGDDKAAALFMLGANSGLGWTMLQLGAKYAEAVNMFGLSYSEIAEVRGKSVQHIKDCIRLTEQSDDIKDAITDGQIAPAQALKLVKSQGSTEAAKTIKAATKAISEGVKAPKGGKITQKVIDSLGDSKVQEMLDRGKEAKAHLSAMLESPAFDKPTKDAIRKTIKATGEPIPTHDSVGEYLLTMADNCNDIVSNAAKVLIRVTSGQFMPANQTEEAKSYAHMMWLSDMTANPNRMRSAAAHWFLAVMSASRSDREVSPPPSIMALQDAIQAEIDSGNAINAESLCPEHAPLVTYLRTGRLG